MARSRYIIINTDTAVIDGLYMDRVFEEKSAAVLREAWPGPQREVEETGKPFPISGRVCLGHVRGVRILKHYRDGLAAEVGVPKIATACS